MAAGDVKAAAMQPQRDLAGKTILVTGATNGIGMEVARALARRDAHVIVGARDPARGQIVAEALRGGEMLALDLASFASIRAAAATLAERFGKLDVLVNNAGVAVAKRTVSRDGHELTWATNVLGPFLLTNALLPLLLAAEEPRVVNVGSTAYRNGQLVWDDLEFERRRFSGLKAYAQSKLALLLLTRALAAREPKLAANCVHPGAIATGIWRELSAPLRFLIGRLLPAPAVGAAPVVRLAAAADPQHASGLYFDAFRAVEPVLAKRDVAETERLWQLALAQTRAANATS